MGMPWREFGGVLDTHDPLVPAATTSYVVGTLISERSSRRCRVPVDSSTQLYSKYNGFWSPGSVTVRTNCLLSLACSVNTFSGLGSEHTVPVPSTSRGSRCNNDESPTLVTQKLYARLGPGTRLVSPVDGRPRRSGTGGPNGNRHPRLIANSGTIARPTITYATTIRGAVQLNVDAGTATAA